MRILYVFFVISLAPTALCRWTNEYRRQSEHNHRNYQTPLEIMVDVTNDLANFVLQDYAHAKGNFAFSPYGVASVLVVLYEGARGETARQIHHALRLPWNRDVTRVGFRDIHRNLVSYFTHEGYLSGMTLSKNHTALREDYKRILRFYGYDVDLVKYPDVTVTGSTTREMANLPSSMDVSPTVRQENTSATTPMVSEENTTTTRKENSAGTTSMASEESNGVTTSMEREENRNGTTLMMREEMNTGTTPMAKEETVTPSMVIEESINGTTSIVREESNGVTTSMMRKENSSTLIMREEKVSTISIPSTTETYSIFTVILPTTPEPDNSTSEEDGSSEVEHEMEDGDKNSDNGEENKVTVVDMRMPSSTKAAPSANSEDDLEDITTTAPSVVEHTTTVEETKDPTIYPSDILNEEDEDDDMNNTTTELPWNLFGDVITVKPEDKNVRAEEPLPSARSTVDTGVTSPRPRTEQVFEELPTTLAPPVVVSSSTEQSKDVTFGGKAITLVAKSPSRETGTDSPAAASNETSETRPVPVSEPAPSALQSASTEATLSEGRAATNLDTNSNLTDVVSPEPSTASQADTTEANKTSEAETPKKRRSVRSIRRVPSYPDMALELDNSMYDSHVHHGSELYTQLPRYTFLVDGVQKEDVPVMSYTTIFPFAYINKLNALALEFPLDDSRYKLLILLPVQPRGLSHLIHEMKTYPLRQVYEALRPTRVNAIIPSFMVEGFVILTPALQQLGIWDVFDPRRCDLSGMSEDPELYVRNVEQSITVVIRNYMEVLDIHTRTLAARMYTQSFFVTHPFLYFVLDTETHVALMAGKIVDPLSSRIY